MDIITLKNNNVHFLTGNIMNRLDISNKLIAQF
jgi:hypothetical protein